MGVLLNVRSVEESSPLVVQGCHQGHHLHNESVNSPPANRCSQSLDSKGNFMDFRAESGNAEALGRLLIC